MTDQNHVILIGRLTRDIGADERSFAYVGSNNTARANISIAVNRSVKKNDQWNDEVFYFDVQIWGKTAENLKQYLQKGKQIAVDGYLKQDRWQKDGQNFSRVYVVANTVQLLGGTKNDNTQTEGQQQFTSNNDNDFPEDIPF
jgi:single-strand DNA-binding protein